MKLGGGSIYPFSLTTDVGEIQNIQLVQRSLTMGWDKSLLDSENKTILDYAKEEKKEDVIKLPQ